MTAELKALVFTPVNGVPNAAVTTTFTLSDQSSATSTPTTDGGTSVVDSDAAVPPTIAGTRGGQSTSAEAAVAPFATVTVGDRNSNATDTLTIALSGGGTLSGAGLTEGTGGIYSLSGSAAAVTGALDALVFIPSAGSPGSSSTTTFTLTDQSSAYGTPTTDAATVVTNSDAAVAPITSPAVNHPSTPSTPTSNPPTSNPPTGNPPTNNVAKASLAVAFDPAVTVTGPQSGHLDRPRLEPERHREGRGLRRVDRPRPGHARR